MEQTLIRHPRLRVFYKTGSEGPRHDPYSFNEYRIEVPGRTVIVHAGLGDWIKINDGTREHIIEGSTNDRVHEACGYSLPQLERFHRKKIKNCPIGGHHDLFTWSGYPGESFSQCSKCNRVVDSTFDRSAIE